MSEISANDFLFEIDTTTAGSPDTEIGGAKTFDLTGGDVSQIDLTKLKGKRKRSAPGKLGQDTFTLNVLTDLSDDGQNAVRAALANGDTKTIKMTAPTGETWTFSGYFTKVPGVSGDIDAAVTSSFDMIIDGDTAATPAA